MSLAVGLIRTQAMQECRESLVRRVFDAALSLAGMIVFAPMALLIALSIKLEDRGPIFYFQERVGRGGRVFRLYKFRSMVPQAESKTGPVLSSTSDNRVTRVGRFLRATALDELPQLWNIFKGDMSFVGPRSERPCFVNQFNQDIPGYALRHRVRPGLTGVAQIFGRYHTTARNKLRYDMITVGHPGLWFEFYLIAISFKITFRGKWTSMEKER